MIILASDTSTNHGSVALRDAAGDIVSVELDPERPHSETLLPAVNEVLSLAGFMRQDVQALAVGIGPGAFTGLRVGLATFKGWASASKLPVIPVSSLDSVAFTGLGQGAGVIVLADARKGEVYACYYPAFDGNGLPARGGEAELVPVRDVSPWIENIGDEKAVILGTGAPIWIEETGQESGSIIRERSNYPLASHILQMGEIMMSMGLTVEPSRLIPDYVRAPDAKPQGKDKTA